MSWFLEVVLVTVLLIAIWAQHQDLVDVRRRLDDRDTSFILLHRQMVDLRRRLLPMSEERRSAVRWHSLPKEYL